ncbi:MAG: branched-chain amino acid ABC transporter permease [Bacillota bacterium]|nr:branched-chain amino acid ABC transporter permease [Bacillota bacterium]
MSSLFALQVVINGVLLGGIYGLSALAFSLIWGVMNIINLAHGVLILMGSYVAWELWSRLGIDPFLSVPLNLGLFFLIGYVLQRRLINLVIRAPVFMTLLLTFGIEYCLINIAHLIWHADYRMISPEYAGMGVRLEGLTVPYVRLGALAMVVALSVGLALFMSRTRLGRAIRATAMDLDAARLMGVRPAVVYAVTMGLGAALAGTAGSLYSVSYPFTPDMGGLLTLKSFVVTVLGGLGNMYGPLLGGLVLGLVESASAVALGAGWVNAVSFGLLVAVLLVRPTTGLFGRKGW